MVLTRLAGRNASGHVQVIGCGTGRVSQCVNVSDGVGAIRCCARTQARCRSVCAGDTPNDGRGLRPNTCTNGYTAHWHEAVAECASHGLHLCTQQQFLSLCCEDSAGCPHQRLEWAWTSDECGMDEPSAAARGAVGGDAAGLGCPKQCSDVCPQLWPSDDSFGATCRRSCGEPHCRQTCCRQGSRSNVGTLLEQLF